MLKEREERKQTTMRKALEDAENRAREEKRLRKLNQQPSSPKQHQQISSYQGNFLLKLQEGFYYIFMQIFNYYFYYYYFVYIFINSLRIYLLF